MSGIKRNWEMLTRIEAIGEDWISTASSRALLATLAERRKMEKQHRTMLLDNTLLGVLLSEENGFFREAPAQVAWACYLIALENLVPLIRQELKIRDGSEQPLTWLDKEWVELSKCLDRLSIIR